MLKDLTHIRYRRLLFSVNDNFLSREAKLDAGINYCIQCPVNIENALSEFYTPLIDLRQSIENIQKEIYHRTLTEINSFTKQDYEHQLLFDLAPIELKKFIDLFNRFATEKKIRPAESFRLNAYNHYGILAVSFIKQNDAYLCINFYRVTKERASNLYSFTLNSDSNDLSRSQLGRAHRALHWLDLLAFKELGAGFYDFCGWYSGNENKALLNVNQFKEQFTKNIVKEFTGVIYKNPLLKLLMRFKKNGYQ